MADQKAIERQWATYLTAIQATVPCTLDEIQLLYRELFPGKQEVYLTYIIADVHDFMVSIFEKNGVQRSYPDVCRAVEHAREEFFARYGPSRSGCP